MCKKFRHPALSCEVTIEERQGIKRALTFRAEFPGATSSLVVVPNQHIVEIDNYLQKRKIADSLDKLLVACDEWGRRQVVRELINMFQEVKN